MSEQLFSTIYIDGKFSLGLPHYARQENFDLIKSNIDRLVVYHGLAEDAFNSYPRFNKFNLSNIFEYMNPKLFEDVSETFLEQR